VAAATLLAASPVVPAPGPRAADAPGSAASTFGGTIAKRGCDTGRAAIGDCGRWPEAGAAETAPEPATSAAVTAANGTTAGVVML